MHYLRKFVSRYWIIADTNRLGAILFQRFTLKVIFDNSKIRATKKQSTPRARSYRYKLFGKSLTRINRFNDHVQIHQKKTYGKKMLRSEKSYWYYTLKASIVDFFDISVKIVDFHFQKLEKWQYN